MDNKIGANPTAAPPNSILVLHGKPLAKDRGELQPDQLEYDYEMSMGNFGTS